MQIFLFLFCSVIRPCAHQFEWASVPIFRHWEHTPHSLHAHRICTFKNTLICTRRILGSSHLFSCSLHLLLHSNRYVLFFFLSIQQTNGNDWKKLHTMFEIVRNKDKNKKFSELPQKYPTNKYSTRSELCRCLTDLLALHPKDMCSK